MTKPEFVAKAYEILSKKGFKEINGEMYFPESAILDMLEWMHENANTTPDFEKGLERLTNVLNTILHR